jgi:hypothetical protein
MPVFQTPPLKALLAGHADGASLIDVLLGELRRFTGRGWEQEDDVTMITLHRRPESPAVKEAGILPVSKS